MAKDVSGSLVRAFVLHADTRTAGVAITTFSACTFRNNSALAGGAVSIFSGFGFYGVVVNSYFMSNSASSDGGGIFFADTTITGRTSAVDIVNSYFCNNIRLPSGGADDVACRLDQGGKLIYNISSLESGGFNCSSLAPATNCRAVSFDGSISNCGMPGSATVPNGVCSTTRSTPADSAIAGNVVVISSPTATFNQPTTITGDAVITTGAALSLGTGGSLTVTGSLTIQPGASISFAANVSGTFVLVSGGSVVGTFSAVTAVPPPGCAATSAPPTYTSTTLSVAVTVDCGSGGGGLSTGAIVGIVVGAVVGGALVAVLGVLLRRYMVRRSDTRAKAQIMQRNHYALNQEYA
jgi:predicted outer membrane repeat protein